MNAAMRPPTLAPRRALCGSAPASRRTVAPTACFMAATRSLVAPCPYRTLGVSLDATEEEIRAAYRGKVRQLHPDRNPSPLASIAFMECQAAYETLGDTELRAKYDRSLLPRAANSQQVLSYLNARSAARHGLNVPTHAPSRGAPYQHRPELYSTLSTLLQQVKSCAKHLEREVLNGKERASKLREHPIEVVLDDPCLEHGECGEPWLYYATAEVSPEQKGLPERRRG